MQELKSSISTLSTRLSTLETAVTNRFAALPLDSEGPPPPQLRTGNPPARPSYAQAVSSMPAILPDAHRAAPEAPAPFEIPPLRTAPVSASTAFVLRLAALRADHAFRSIEPRRVLAKPWRQHTRAPCSSPRCGAGPSSCTTYLSRSRRAKSCRKSEQRPERHRTADTPPARRRIPSPQPDCFLPRLRRRRSRHASQPGMATWGVGTSSA